jgi:mxaJ protein
MREIFLLAYPLTRRFQLLELCGEVPEEGSLLDKPVPGHVGPAPPDLENRFDHVVHMALGIDPTGADPNNLPFSNQRLEGLENRLAALVAREMRTQVTYVWWAQRRGFFRNTLNARLCDVVMGVPHNLPSVLTTRPHYRSTFVFVSQKDRGPIITSLDEPALERLRIGVQVVGEGANTPPMDALARRGLARNLVGYTVFGDYTQPNPPARIMEAVARGDIDVAVVWGPLAGYFATRLPVPLAIAPVPGEAEEGSAPLAFSISIGVRKEDRRLRAALDRILERRRAEIERILDDYGAPRVSPDAPSE